jgi:hypothetical protein
MKNLSQFLLLLCTVSLISCTFRTYEGEVTTEKRSTNNYERIQVRGPFDVSIEEGVSGGLTITAPADAMVDITTEVVGDELIIDLEGTGITTQTFEVEVANSELDKIGMYGSGVFEGEVTVKDQLILELGGSGAIIVKANPDKLKASVSGSGVIEVEGRTSKVIADVSGSGGIDLENMQAVDAALELSGSGFITANASGLLKADLSGSGEIRYSGNPTEIDRTVSGSGDIRSF